MTLIMDLTGPELSEVFAFELRKIVIFDFVYTLASANLDQSTPNLVTIYMTNRSWMNSIMGIIRRGHPELFAFELEKIKEFDFVYTLAFKNIQISTNQH